MPLEFKMPKLGKRNLNQRALPEVAGYLQNIRHGHREGQHNLPRNMTNTCLVGVLVYLLALPISAPVAYGDSAYINVHQNFPVELIVSLGGLEKHDRLNFERSGFSFLYTTPQMGKDDIYRYGNSCQEGQGCYTVIVNPYSAAPPYTRASVFALMKTIDAMIETEGRNHALLTERVEKHVEWVEDFVSAVELLIDSLALINSEIGSEFLYNSITTYADFQNVMITVKDDSGKTQKFSIGAYITSRVISGGYLNDSEQARIFVDHAIKWIWQVIGQFTEQLDAKFFKLLKTKATDRFGNVLFALSSALSLSDSFTKFVFATKLDKSTDVLNAMVLAQRFIYDLAFQYNGSLSALARATSHQLDSPMTIVSCDVEFSCHGGTFTPQLSTFWQLFYWYMTKVAQVNKNDAQLLDSAVYYAYLALSDSGYRYRVKVGYDKDGNLELSRDMSASLYPYFPSLIDYTVGKGKGYLYTKPDLPEQSSSPVYRYDAQWNPTQTHQDSNRVLYYRADDSGQATPINGITIINSSITLGLQQEVGYFSRSWRTILTGELESTMNIAVPSHAEGWASKTCLTTQEEYLETESGFKYLTSITCVPLSF